MDPMVKDNSSTPQDDNIIFNLNPKSCSIESITSLRGICHPISCTCDQVQGNKTTQVQGQEGEDIFDLPFLYEIPPCQYDDPPFLDYFEFVNLGSESNEINLLRSVILGNNYFDDDDYIDICDDEFSRAPIFRLLEKILV